VAESSAAGVGDSAAEWPVCEPAVYVAAAGQGWGRLAEAAEDITFASAVIGDDSSSCHPLLLPDRSAAADRSLSPQACATAAPGRIEIVLVCGHRVIVDDDVDAAALARVVAVLEQSMRKGFANLSLQVQEVLRRDPLGGHLFCFRGRSGSLLKVIWHDGEGGLPVQRFSSVFHQTMESHPP
jgi:IS66 Orf2 like protein